MLTGRKPHDPSRLAAVAPYIVDYDPPDVLDRSAIPFNPGLYQNDIAPVCTVAGLANDARATAWINLGSDIFVDAEKIAPFYASVAGCPDDIISICDTDGVSMLDVLEAASDRGFDVGEQVALVPTWRRIDITDRRALAHACLRGAAYLGVNLAAVDRVAPFWDTGLPASLGDATPGSWAEHCLLLWDYMGLGDDDEIRLPTFGVKQRATWRWLDSRIANQEAYALSWRQLGS